MQFLNGYKCDVIDIEILRLSSTLFQLNGNMVSCGGTVSYLIRVRLLDCSSKFYFKEGGFES
jgi:translation initiation factor 2B subunit (eIF-2B alpha/beta/delta family)